ncbi:MAG: hypothetical protein IT518_05770 [Burkholderiales bacterium]|nr:hypothetical protein [Burkholderiales bacterium]
MQATLLDNPVASTSAASMTRPTSASLFDDDADQDFPLAMALAQSKPTTKAERSFQQLVGKIERKREELKQWQAYELRYRQRVADEVEPLQAQLRTDQRQMAELIDELLSQPARGRTLGRVQRAKLTQLLMELVTELLADGDRDDALEALHDKYGEMSRDERRRAELEITEALLADVLGIDIDDDHNASTSDELLEHATRKLGERVEADRRQAEDRHRARESKRAGANAANRDAAAAKREQAAKEVSQSLRDVYRKLASALHPDREQDADARQRKTLLMQRVNRAYDASDLLTLLGLQLEIEQIDAAHLSSVTPQRLAHYNKILREQLAELESEVERHARPFRQGADMFSNAMLTPAAVDRDLSESVAQLQLVLRELREDLVAFRDPALLRDRLENYELVTDAEAPAVLDALLQDFAGLLPARRGKKRRRR